MRSPWFWISVGIHVGVFVLLWDTGWDPEDLQEVLPVEVQWVEKPLVSKPPGPSGKRGKPMRSKSEPAVSLKDLKPAFLKNSYQVRPSARTGGFENEKVAGEHQQWGSGAQDFNQVLNYLTYEKLFHKIDGLIQYPGLLVQHRMQGVVNLQLIVSKTGCRPISYFKASNRYLGVYLKKLFQHKICKADFLNQVLNEKEHRLDFSFTFELRESSLPPDPSPQRLQGNLLAYYRFAPVTKLEWRLGPVRGIWGVPAVAVDFPWLFEQWAKQVEGQDPMDEFRK